MTLPSISHIGVLKHATCIVWESIAGACIEAKRHWRFAHAPQPIWWDALWALHHKRKFTTGLQTPEVGHHQLSL